MLQKIAIYSPRKGLVHQNYSLQFHINTSKQPTTIPWKDLQEPTKCSMCIVHHSFWTSAKSIVSDSRRFLSFTHIIASSSTAPLREYSDVILIGYAEPEDACDGDNKDYGQEAGKHYDGPEVVQHVQLLL